MKMVSLAEFQNVTGLSNKAMLWLIKNNKLNFDYSKTKGLSVDITQVNKSHLVQALIQKEQSGVEAEKQIIKEQLSLVISERLEDMLNEAITHLVKHSSSK